MTTAFTAWLAISFLSVLFVHSGGKRQVSDPVRASLEERA
jgi:hypothetical protein